MKRKIDSRLFSSRLKAQGFKSGLTTAGKKAVLGKESKGYRVSYKK